MTDRDRDALVEEAVEAMVLALKRYDPTLYEKESWDITLCNIKPIVRSVLATFASILHTTTSAGPKWPDCADCGQPRAEHRVPMAGDFLWCPGDKIRTYVPTTIAGDGELVERLRSEQRIPGTLVHKLLRYAEINEDKETSFHGRKATNSWAEGFRAAVAEIEALTSRVKELEEAMRSARGHIRRGRDMVPDDDESLVSDVFARAINHAERDLASALNPSPTEQGEQA